MNLDEESEDYNLIHGGKGSLLNHIRIYMREDYKIHKDILKGRNVNFNQFKCRGKDMFVIRQDSEL